MADPIDDMRRPATPFPRRRLAAFAYSPLLLVASCHPAKSVDYYRANTIERDKMVNRCLATSSNSWDCVNAITAEAERWGTKDVDGFTVVISGDGPTQTPPHP